MEPADDVTVTSDDDQAPIARTSLPVVGIAGGHGGMGSFFARTLEAAGAIVHVSDRETELTNAGLAARCNLILVAVPLRATPSVLTEIAPHVRFGTALASLGSLMEPAVPPLRRCAGEAFLLHPLFGPGRRTLDGTTLAAASLRGGRWRGWLLGLLRERGAAVMTTTPEAHDRAMAVAQALLHGTSAALASEIMSGLQGDNPLAWTSPTLRLQLALMSRILHQDPALYGDLVALNRHTPLVIDGLIERLEELRGAATDGPDAVAALFAAARDALGPHGQELAVEGNRLLGEA